MSVSPQIRATYDELCSAPADADAAWKRGRGYKFERLLVELLRADHLDPRASYRPAGEQIDGSFFLDGTVFLLEAKWHAEPVPASVLYEFKGKVDGKLVGTLGVFLSMSGYSEDAADTLTRGKSLNVILWDGRDMDAAISRGLGFREVLRRKLRKAAEEGTVYFPSEADLITRDATVRVESENLDIATGMNRRVTRGDAPAGMRDLVIVCKGDRDREVIVRLGRRILKQENSERSIVIVPAMGKLSVPRMANAIHDSLAPDAKILLVVDADEGVDDSMQTLAREIRFSDWQAAIPDPHIGAWLGLAHRTLNARNPALRRQSISEAVERIDLESLRQSDAAFADFYSACVKA